MIAEIDTFGRAKVRSADSGHLTGLKFKCRRCGVEFSFKGVTYLYLVKVGTSTTLMTFAPLPWPGTKHAVVHTCGADVDAVPLWGPPEWS